MRELLPADRLYCLLNLISDESLAKINSIEELDESSSVGLQAVADLAQNLTGHPDAAYITGAMCDLLVLLAAEELRRAGLLRKPGYPKTLEDYEGISGSLVVDLSGANIVFRPELTEVSVQARNLYESILSVCTGATEAVC